jgi:hypothetical protein
LKRALALPTEAGAEPRSRVRCSLPLPLGGV